MARIRIRKPGKATKKKPLRVERLPSKVEPGFVERRGIYVPESVAKPVAPSKLQKGLVTAQSQIRKMLDAILPEDGSFEVKEISLEVSFSADGKFLGIGVGGATSMTIKIAPTRTKL